LIILAERVGDPVELVRRDLRPLDRLHFGKVDSSGRASGDVVLQDRMVEARSVP